jgi:hypothetical protein
MVQKKSSSKRKTSSKKKTERVDATIHNDKAFSFAKNFLEGIKQFTIVCKGLYKFSAFLLLITLLYYNVGLFVVWVIILIGAFTNIVFKN